MEYAIVKTGGKQYKVSKGTVLEVDKLDTQGKDVVLSEVLLLSTDGKIKIGKPFLSNVKIKAKLLENKKGEKVRVAKFKAKAKYRRVMGFRPQISVLEIEEIVSDGKSLEEKTNKKISKKPVKSE